MDEITKARQFHQYWRECEPFYGGKSIIPHHQALLYYTHPDDNTHRRIDFSKAGTDELAALYDACKPASFGLGGETLHDETYRKARKLDPESFVTAFDPRSFGILDQITKKLLTGKRLYGINDMELYKLNAYGVGDFFKPHKDTPRGQNMVGSLVVVLPTRHEGGQLVLRKDKEEWTIDLASKIAAATEPSVGFVAFFGDVEHEVLPITSGYRFTLTYNLYSKTSHPVASYIPTPFHERLKKALVDLVNDNKVLPEGGYLGYGLLHEYVYDADRPINMLLDHLKGMDQLLASICEELGLKVSLTLLYRDLCERNVDVIADRRLVMGDSPLGYDIDDGPYWRDTSYNSARAGVNFEGVDIVGKESDESDKAPLGDIFRDPVTRILEIRTMSSVEAESSYMHYGNESTVEYTYGQACMLIELDPVPRRLEA